MIKSFKSKGLKLFAETGSTRKLAVQNPKRLALILQMLDAAKGPGDMFNLPGLRMHPLGIMAPGRWAVDASGNWRVTFAFEGENVVEVDLEDYH